MNDRLDFSIDGVKKSVEEMRANNELNKKNKQSFLEYIDSSLKPEWNTTEGKIAVEELITFVNGQFSDYINYLDQRIDTLDNNVIPKLINIDNA